LIRLGQSLIEQGAEAVDENDGTEARAPVSVDRPCRRPCSMHRKKLCRTG